MRGKLIVIEGTDCSGKETQTKKLVERLRSEGKKVGTISYPMYETPTGKIVGACLLGKPSMCDEFLKTEGGFFPEGGGSVDSMTALMYYAADRRYNLPKLDELLENNDIVIADRYTTSNMAHRGGQILDEAKRLKMYKDIEAIEYEILELPRPDKVIFLHLSYECSLEFKKSRAEVLDEAERNVEYLKNGEKAYLELANLYNYETIECVNERGIKSIEQVHEEVYEKTIGLESKNLAK